MTCPTELQLRAFCLGELPPHTATEIRAHLEHCPSCQRRSQQLDTKLDAHLAQPRRASGEAPAGATRVIDGAGRTTPAGLSVQTPTSYPFLLPAVQADEIGRLGGYRVLGLLGKGGMAYVFWAEDIALQRPVALKVMKPELGHDPEGWQRFLREARIMAAVKHEHLATVYQVGQEGSTVYLAMELLQGESLGTRLDREPAVPLPEILRLGREIAAGLAVVHGHGLVHRDIKPDNIWLEAPAGRVKILDFGLARLAHSDVRLTQAGTIMGTPSFMAPEQARGLPVDARSDLFSLGGILYTLCTGQQPFAAEETMALLTALAVDVPQPVLELNPLVPPALASLVMQLLAKDPDERPASAQEVAERISAIERDLGPLPAPPMRPTVSRRDDTPVQALRQPAPPARRWPWLAGAAGLVLSVGLALLLFSRGASRPEPEEAPPARVAVPTAPAKLPVKVFLLAGQSDMGGRAAIRTLDWIGQDPRHAYLLQKLRGADGQWVVRPDVWVHYQRENGTKKGPLSVGFGVTDNEIGPELLFGHVLGDHLDNPVLLIKVVHGPLSLAVEGRPPSAGGQVGPFYRRMTQTIRDVLANPDIFFPGYQGQGVELAGFVWFQGWNDLIKLDYRLQYSANLAHLIRDVRRDLGVPYLPVVIGEMGVNGDRPSGEIEALREAQLLATRQPGFQGNVALASTHDLWEREADDLYRKFWIRGQWQDPVAHAHFDQMGSQMEYLYLGCGKIYARIGESFGKAMLTLLRRPYR